MLALQSLVSWMSDLQDYTKPCIQCISYTHLAEVLYWQLAIFSCPSTCLARSFKLYVCYYDLIILMVMRSKVISVFHSSIPFHHHSILLILDSLSQFRCAAHAFSFFVVVLCAYTKNQRPQWFATWTVTIKSLKIPTLIHQLQPAL